MSNHTKTLHGNPKAIATYLTKAMDPDDRAAFPKALLNVVREYGASAFAEKAGCGEKRFIGP
jgi:DNA-binding phage protein